ncbi:TraB/GumN family protein [Flavobacterium sp. MFBS3-15]|uniref:TraB/GumN family protein n=1 Tax=Flavobacterium sp. MFBS3-15 TaxID=2989816 RepID=UPI0022362201|nr:TraB/GumN family protein [Flavobacterium sp. MFBS3-15]MCW4468483.1 TraB/GumN family protein [Flavobacterium sp. MFBS3-15]
MKSYFALLLLIICSGCTSQALEKSLLWKISGNGLAEPSYLFGTLHSACTIEMDNKITDAIGSTKQLYLEIDYQDPDFEKEFAEAPRDMKEGITIESMLSDEDFQLLDTYFIENKGRSVRIHNTLKPEFINMMLTSKILDCTTKSYEEEIVAITKRQGKETFGLEKIKFQVMMYDRIPYSIQLEGLMKNIKDNLANGRKKAKIMAAMYEEEDIEGLENFIRNSDNKTYSNYADIILSERNRAWIPKIEEAAKAKPTFFAFGVTHLAGTEGVIMLLRKKGYKVEAVK